MLQLPELQDWFAVKDPHKRNALPLTQQQLNAVSSYVFRNYLTHFAKEGMAEAFAVIPQVMVRSEQTLRLQAGCLNTALRCCKFLANALRNALRCRHRPAAPCLQVWDDHDIFDGAAHPFHHTAWPVCCKETILEHHCSTAKNAAACAACRHSSGLQHGLSDCFPVGC